MSLLTYHELTRLAAEGVITGVDPAHINAASIDVTLGPTLWIECRTGGPVDLAAKQTPHLVQRNLHLFPFHLQPGQFVLAQTREQFNLPFDLAAEFRLKSSIARAGLDQALAVWCDPGWHGSVLTLELTNTLRHHTLILREAMKIGQMVFWRGAGVPAAMSYAARGQYNGDTHAQPAKDLR